MNDFESVVKSRRSASKFTQGIDISQKELEQIFALVKFAPSAYNLQHANYVVVTDPLVKQKVYDASYKQYKILSSSAVIVVLGDLEAYKDSARINEGLFHLGFFSKQELDAEVQQVTNFYEERGEPFKRDEAIRNASLSAMLLTAKDQGWDTCPMIGFEADKLIEALQIDERYVPAMLITIGKEDTSSQRPRGYRKPIGEFVKYI
ncbi:nitroreductase family protein [Paenibacillus sp. Root444D2]|uniref:nitroreductase family protein n=1 Tax=Paenibacillus sp. Root444D2 TaxID=1736538 RepID=UPI00070E632C|nr:nitroreductase family protein [Paenibacillus sp. Root444D2]KQX64690.1 NAD(P)H nitroreductase [Paenibacillus sp. Root444D2]